MSYTLLEKYHTGSATDLNNDYYHVGQGSLAPRGNASLELTTGVYDLGSSAASWNNAYINTINLGSGTVNRCMNMIAEVTLTATASSIEFTGLNGETDVIYEINFDLYGYATQSAYLFLNSDSTTNQYGYQQLYAISTTVGSVRSTSIGGIWVGRTGINTTTALYSKSNLIFFANNISKLILSKNSDSIGWTNVFSVIYFGYVWNNSATLTSMKFIGYFNPGTHIEIWGKR
jgi:hypothetical protein